VALAGLLLLLFVSYRRCSCNCWWLAAMWLLLLLLLGWLLWLIKVGRGDDLRGVATTNEAECDSCVSVCIQRPALALCPAHRTTQ
jgi:hypothetical protein